MVQVDAAFVEPALHIPKRDWEADTEHYRQADDLRAGLDATIGAQSGHPKTLGPPPAPLKRSFF